MAEELFANNYSTTLNGGVNNSVTTVVMNAAVPASLAAGGQWRLLIDSEIMLVTNVNVDNVTLTVSRGIEGTTAATHSNGANCAHVFTKGALDTFRANSLLSGPTASLPSAGYAGRSYYATDAPVQYVDNGSTWDAIVKGNYIPSANIPTTGMFSWTNQGTSTISNAYGGVNVVSQTTWIPGPSVVDVAWGLNKTLTALICFTPQDRSDHNGWLCGISLRKAGNNAAYILGEYNLPPPNFTGAYFSNISGAWSNNFNSNDQRLGAAGQYLWIQMIDNGSTITYQSSVDGINYERCYQQGNTLGNAWGVGVTPDRIGIGVAQCNAHCMSWKVV